MSKIITSPVKKYPGTVTLADPLTFPQAIAFEGMLDAVKTLNGDATQTKVNQVCLPGILACVEDWKLDNFPDAPALDNWPATPRVASATLVDWLISEITGLYGEAEPDPNE